MRNLWDTPRPPVGNILRLFGLTLSYLGAESLDGTVSLSHLYDIAADGIGMAPRRSRVVIETMVQFHAAHGGPSCFLRIKSLPHRLSTDAC